MRKFKWIIILLNLIFLMVYFNYSIIKKEKMIVGGQLILLELAPVDPRSLMQGDYMTLSYKISQDIHTDSISKRGYCVVRIDSSGIAQRVRFQNGKTPLNQNEHLINYTSPSEWRINIGAESFFFQEGMASKYDNAKYGGVKIDNNGNSLLIGLYDENQNKIE